MPLHLEPVPEPTADADELRARLESAIVGAIVIADSMHECVLHGDWPDAVRFAAEYKEHRANMRRIRAWLAEAEGREVS